MLDLPRRKFALVIEVGGAVDRDALRFILPHLTVAAENARLQSGKVIACKAQRLGQPDRRFDVDEVALCHLLQRVLGGVRNRKDLLVVEPALRVERQGDVDLTAAGQ